MKIHRPPIFSPQRMLLASALLIGATALAATSSDEAAFLAENDAAMEKMMSAMQIKPTGNVDADFVAMMIPHHQGAIDMARAQLRYGHNEQLRRLSQEIIATQGEEIATMRLALGQPLPPSVPSPTSAPHPSSPLMHMNMEH